VNTKQLQCLLTYLGYDPGGIDGAWGTKTSSALMLFQSDYGIKADGYPGNESYTALRDAVYNGMHKAEQDQSEPAHDDTTAKAGDLGVPYFTWDEFKCKCSDPNCEGKTMKPSSALLSKLVDIRVRFGAPVTISSGIRCPAHNASVGGVANSYHLSGRAADINVRGQTSERVAAYCSGLQLHYYYCIDSSYIHIDI